MGEPVNPRGYDNSGRQARTRRTRAAILTAAEALFTERGYVATTIEAISDLGQASPATVYRLFGSKPGVLTALLDVAATGDEAPLALGDRPHVRVLLAETDPHRALRGFAALARDVVGRLAPLHRILVAAADSDPEAAALLAEANRQRRQGQARITRALAAGGHLRTGLTQAQAADIVYALMSPEVNRLLTGECGWSPKWYERWLADTLTAQLLAPPSATTRP